MAMDFFRVVRGIDIQSQDLTNNVHLLFGDGEPGGDGGEQDNAPIGSIYLRTDSQSDGRQLYWKSSTSGDDTSDWELVVEQGHSHSASDITSGTFDDDRISESSVTQHESAITITESQISDLGNYIEDITGEDIGDLNDVDISSPSDDQVLVYSGGTWVNDTISSGAESLDELNDTDISSPAGDDVLKYDGANDQWINGTVSFSELSGEASDGQIPESAVTQHESSISIESSQISDLPLDSGDDVDASGTITTDSVSTDTATQVRWLVQVRETESPDNRRAVEVHAMTDGTNIDYTQYSVLQLGSSIAGFDLEVDLDSDDIRLRLTADNNIDYRVQRMAITAF